MVRKVSIALAIVALLCATGTATHAASYTVYDGVPSNTYIQYFEDILAGSGFNDDYVCFRAGQSEYVMAVGPLEYDGTSIYSDEVVTIYVISSDGSYNSYYAYHVSEDADFSVALSDKIIYSNLGQFPQLVDIGEKYEILQTFTLCAVVLFALCGRIFGKR